MNRDMFYLGFTTVSSKFSALPVFTVIYGVTIEVVVTDKKNFSCEYRSDCEVASYDRVEDKCPNITKFTKILYRCPTGTFSKLN